MRTSIEIIDYRPEHQPVFERLNRHWIEKHFWLEEIDKYVLQHPQEAILDKGGAILMALYDGVPAGTVALKKTGENTYEFTKMAVDEAYRRKGIAEAISYASFEKARNLGAEKVILYSNRILVPAITMYHKLGFREVPIEPGVYERSDIKMEIDLATDAPLQSTTDKELFHHPVNRSI
ncbi:MAG TPA: GNAT family N-acetyltransferase [Flavisolibacter sp.]|jgi:ribosomal protein S18 acetylase RimI-like enzyme|nr:GNAT family N-acetyltransferase [Flavisolibacter sp.]